MTKAGEDIIVRIETRKDFERVKEVISLEHTLSREGITEYSNLYNLGDMASLRQQVAIAKLPECTQFIGDTLEVVDKLVVFYYHRIVGTVLHHNLKKIYGVNWLKGGMSSIQKSLAVASFINNPKKRIFLAQLQAAGEAIDGLHKVCNHGIFVETSWIPKDILQAVGRLRRMEGLGKPIQIQILAAVGTIEYQILNSVIRKRQIIRKVVDD